MMVDHPLTSWVQSSTSNTVFTRVSKDPLLASEGGPTTTPTPTVGAVVGEGEGVFFAIRSFSLYYLQVSRFLVGTNTPLVGRYVSRVGVFARGVGGWAGEWWCLFRCDAVPPTGGGRNFLFLFEVVIFGVVIPLFFSTTISSVPNAELYPLVPFVRVSFLFLLCVMPSFL